jgi:hypothetical protein
VDEIEARVDQSTVKIEDYELDAAGIKRAGHSGRIAKEVTQASATTPTKKP